MIPEGTSTELLQAQLEACKELRDYYKSKGAGMVCCLLCRAQTRRRKSVFCEEGIPKCPWHWFEGVDCVDWRDANFFKANVDDYRRHPTPAWRKKRIQMLDEWIPAIEQEIKERS